MVGQTLLKRYADYSYVGAQAVSDYPNPADRNSFFAAVGALPPIGSEQGARLEAMSNAEALDHFRRAAG